MENRANTALIGAFTLLVLALAFGFIYWMARADGRTETARMRVVFTGPVSGLSAGSPVLFNGIRVGEVQRLAIDRQDPRRVIADLRVDATTPVKTDTSASVGFQGLTGVAYVELIGGSPEAPGAWAEAEGGVAVLMAERSAVQDLMSGARQLMGRADETLSAIRGLVRDNSEAVNRSIANLETFTSALSQNADQIATFVESVSGAAENISRLSGRLEEVVARGEAVIAAVEPEAVRRTVENVAGFSDTLAASREEIDGLVTRFSTIAADVNAFTARLDTIGARADLLVADLGERTGALFDALEPDAIGRTVDNLDRITAAVDPARVQQAIANIEQVTGAVEPEAVRTTVANIADFSETLASRRQDIDVLVTRLSAISADATAFAAGLPALRERVDAVAAAVDPEKVGESVDQVHRFATALGGSSEDVEAIVADVRATAERFNALSQRADSMIANLDDLAGGEGGGLLTEMHQTLDSIRVAADSFSTQAESISGGINQFTERGLRELQAFVGQGRRAASRLERIIGELERDPGQFLFGGEGVPEYSGQRR
jgi:phospholipid/cholesterol/gamma-HCH transport system substrate-binding protein